MNDSGRAKPGLPRRYSIARVLRNTALLVTALALAGCATYPPDLASNDRVRIATRDSRNAWVDGVQVRIIDRALTVSGHLRKRYQARGPIPGRLFIEAVGEDGAVLERVAGSYHRRSAKSRRSYFSEILTIRPDQVREVRVIHQGLGGSTG